MHLAVNCLPLLESPASPLALHAYELTQALLSDDRIERISWIGPGPAPADRLADVDWHQAPGGLDPLGVLRFEQRGLPMLVDQIGADVLLSLTHHAPLRSRRPVVVGDGRPPAAPRAGFAERLRRAVGVAGAGGAIEFHWGDRPALPGESGGRAIQPWVGPQFRPTTAGDDSQVRDGLGLPPAYVLSHGVEQVDIGLLLAAWSWVEASIGDAYRLVVAGLTPKARNAFDRAADDLDLADTVQALGSLTWDQLPAIYRGATAFLHLGFTANGQELRWALATGTPVAGVEAPTASAIVGEAGYLVAAGEARTLGAACLGLLVERDEMGRQLGQAGMQRAGSYHQPEAVASLVDLLASAAGSKEA